MVKLSQLEPQSSDCGSQIQSETVGQLRFVNSVGTAVGRLQFTQDRVSQNCRWMTTVAHGRSCSQTIMYPTLGKPWLASRSVLE